MADTPMPSTGDVRTARPHVWGVRVLIGVDLYIVTACTPPPSTATSIQTASRSPERSGSLGAPRPSRPPLPPDRPAIAFTRGIRELLQRLNKRRLRTNPRVVKRKMSNYAHKRAEHRHWPKPTKPPREALAVRRPNLS